MWSDYYPSLKQQALIKYKAFQLGFTDGPFLDLYLTNLARIANESRHLAAISHEEFESRLRIELDKQRAENVLNPRRPPWLDLSNYDDTGTHYIPRHLDILGYIIEEVKNKKDGSLKRKEVNLQSISATDLAHFNFCPASYAIAKTFETDTLESAVIGTNFHEQKRLLPQPLREVSGDRKQQSANWRNEGNKVFFDAIKDATALFSGHDGSKKYFRSKKGKFIGQPDYIFRKQDGSTFIVEEKFQYLNQKQAEQFETTGSYGIYFKDNHKIQLASYIYCLDEFQAQEGYLVYWLYQVDDKSAWIVNCLVHCVTKTTATHDFLRDTYLSLLNFQNSQKIFFEPARLNANKCARCVVNRFCGHKTGRFNELELPYQNKYLQLVSTPYPEELKNSPIIPLTDTPSKADSN